MLITCFRGGLLPHDNCLAVLLGLHLLLEGVEVGQAHQTHLLLSMLFVGFTQGAHEADLFAMGLLPR